jgi:hypothetical protein
MMLLNNVLITIDLAAVLCNKLLELVVLLTITALLLLNVGVFLGQLPLKLVLNKPLLVSIHI